MNYDSPISLDWMGYSLYGQSNITINGDTVMKMPGIGEHSIQVFGSDSSGNIHESEIIFFSIGSSSTFPSTPSPFSFDLIITSTLSVIIGITCLMIILLFITRRRKTIEIIPKEGPPINTNVDAFFPCPYCHTEIDPKSD